MTSPVISVIVAAYKAAGTLPACIDSILAQTFTDFEIIVIDDASKDDTRACIEALQKRDSRIRPIAKDINGGPAVARNAGLDAAAGQWIAIVDADDTILPGRFAAMLAIAETEGADIIFDNMFYITGDKASLYIAEKFPVFGRLPLHTFIHSHRWSDPAPNLGFLKPLIRRDIIEKFQVRYDASLRVGEDAKLIKTLMAHGAAAWFMKDAFYKYHRHAGSISSKLTMDQVKQHNDDYVAFLNNFRDRLDPASIQALQALINDNDRRLRVTALYNILRRNGPVAFIRAVQADCAAGIVCADFTRRIEAAVKKRMRRFS